MHISELCDYCYNNNLCPKETIDCSDCPIDKLGYLHNTDKIYISIKLKEKNNEDKKI